MDLKKKWFKFVAVIFIPALIFGISASALAAEVKVGALNDVTGATSDVGKDYALGIADAIRYVNDNGGVNGKPIKLYQFDYGYRIPEALTKYKLFKRLGCVAVLGWGTGDTEALSPTVTQDKMPYVSASYSAHLTNPAKTPYNLFAATDYSTMPGPPSRHGMTPAGKRTRNSENGNPSSSAATTSPTRIAAHPSKPSRIRQNCWGLKWVRIRMFRWWPLTQRARFWP